MEGLGSYRGIVRLGYQTIIALAIDLENRRALAVQPSLHMARQCREESCDRYRESVGMDHLGGRRCQIRATVEAVAALEEFNT